LYFRFYARRVASHGLLSGFSVQNCALVGCPDLFLLLTQKRFKLGRTDTQLNVAMHRMS
jgi:hypothetical protein